MSEIRADKLHNVTGDNDSGIDLSTNDQVDINIAGSLKARVDSSGNLLVSHTSAYSPISNGGSGSSLMANGQIFGGSTSPVLYLNREDSNGDIAIFRKDGTTVGALGAEGSDSLYIQGGTTSGCGLHFHPSTAQVAPLRNGARIDNVIDIGGSSHRFDDVRATNGTIQTSDQQEKNTITDSDLGLDFVKRLSPKSYIFNGKTRTHYGLIAQDVETVLSDINKPTSGFAGFIKDDISEEQDGSQYRYGLRYTEFVAPLIKAVKDQQAIIEDLQARITALENQ